MDDNKQLLEAAARAAGTIHDVGNACMFREQCRAMAARIAHLEESLHGLSSMYANTWDLADGSGLFMPAASIPRFEEAHRQARIALGKPLVGDDGIDPDAACDPHQKGDGNGR